jgi:hypothetical protein
VATNDVNYIMLKRRDSGGHMPPLSLKRVFCIFARLDKFLGGDGLLAKKSEFWKADDTVDEELRKKYAEQETPDEILSEIIASTPSILEDRREKWTIIVFSASMLLDPFALVVQDCKNVAIFLDYCSYSRHTVRLVAIALAQVRHAPIAD